MKVLLHFRIKQSFNIPQTFSFPAKWYISIKTTYWALFYFTEHRASSFILNVLFQISKVLREKALNPSFSPSAFSNSNQQTEYTNLYIQASDHRNNVFKWFYKRIAATLGWLQHSLFYCSSATGWCLLFPWLEFHRF